MVFENIYNLLHSSGELKEGFFIGSSLRTVPYVQVILKLNHIECSEYPNLCPFGRRSH